MNRSSRQKVNKGTAALNETLDQIDLINLYRTLHLSAAEYIFFSSAQGTFSKIDHIDMLRYKTGLNKYKKTEIVSKIFSDHMA